MPTQKEQGFYKKSVWKRLRIQALNRDHWLCQECLRKGMINTAEEVHHIKPLEDFPELGLCLDNLESLCRDCHAATRVRKQKTVTVPGVRIIRA